MDRYSRMVAWLKVILPLIALGLLSVLFLLSQNTDPVASIPFAKAEIDARLRDQQVTGPFFSGSSTRGDQITFSAEKIGNGARDGAMHARDLKVEIDLASGARVEFTAEDGKVDILSQSSSLSGNVQITTSSGYKISSKQLAFSLTSVDVKSLGEVTVEGPLGTLVAGSMKIIVPEHSENAQLIFTNKVNLVYDPKIKRE